MDGMGYIIIISTDDVARYWKNYQGGEVPKSKKSTAKPDVFWNVTPNGKEKHRKKHNANGKLEAFQQGFL